MTTVAPRAAISCLPSGPGVYRFRDARGRILYIGRAVDLRRRVGSYWADLKDRRHLNRMVPQIAGIEAVVCDSAHEAAWLERNLLEKSKPRWNRIRGGAEVPVYIRLERRPGWARLAVVHGPQDGHGDLFGPYLGGTQARLAVSALDRVLPLRYADDRLSGSQRDMARARGADLLERDALLATVTAVLQREPGAIETVKGLLARQRDRASAGLAFELAARIQEELEAVDWVVAEQKVTLPAGDYDVYGWADGLLVHFEVRSGRLNAWKQRQAHQSVEVQRLLKRTPPGWRAFATRSADLARRLDGLS